MTTIKLSEARAHLGKYARKASKGACFIIADRNKAVAQLGPLPEAEIGIRPTLGLFDGQARIPDDFDAPMKEFESDFYGG